MALTPVEPPSTRSTSWQTAYPVYTKTHSEFARDLDVWAPPLPGWKTRTWSHSALGVGWCTRKDDRRSPALPSCPPPIRFTSPVLESNHIRLDDGPMSLVRFARRGASAIGRPHPQRSSMAGEAATSPCSTTERAAAAAASLSASFRDLPASWSAMRTVTSRWANLMPSRSNSSRMRANTCCAPSTDRPAES